MEAQLIHISPEVYEQRKARYETRINAMLDYVTNDTYAAAVCCWTTSERENEHNCGQCDTCIGTQTNASCQPDREELCAKSAEKIVR